MAKKPQNSDKPKPASPPPQPDRPRPTPPTSNEIRTNLPPDRPIKT